MRPYTPADVDVLHQLWTDPEVRRHLWDDEVIQRERADEEVQNSMALFQSHGFGQWAVFDRGAEELIGFCGYRFFHEPPELQLLYGLAPSHWGRGLATEAARAMIAYGFEQLEFDEVVGSTDYANHASVRVMEKCGMSFEKRAEVDGLDTVYYRILRKGFDGGANAKG